MPPARRSARTAPSTAARESAPPYARANRRASPAPTRPSASIAPGKTSLRLTVKAPPSKLRQATSGSAPLPPNPYIDDASESDATPAPAIRTARATRNPRTVVEPESDEDDEDDVGGDEEQDDDQDEEMEDAEQDDLANDDSEDEDAEGEEEDEELDDHPPPPLIVQQHRASKIKPNVTVTAPSEGPMKSVEDKEMEDDEDEEDLSDLDSNGNENDEDEDEDDDSDDDDDDEDGSRSATPDLSKLTRRQRGFYEEKEPDLMALSNEAQKKKHLTAEEHAMRRSEMARRRKTLSEKRNEEEKMDTINKLLKKPAPKRRTRAEIIAQQHADALATPGAEEGDEERPDAMFVRWVNCREGSRLGVPEEWLEAPVGDVFVRSGPSAALGAGQMIEEVA